MRTVTYGAACSLDGFIAGPGGALDWLQMSADAQAVMAAYWPTVDTILMGRKTYEFAIGAGAGSEEADPGGMTTVVFSRTLPPLRRRGVELVREGAADFVRALKARPGRGICLMGGGDLARSLLAEGVVDEVSLNIHPVLLGSGVPFFRDGGRIGLELIASRVLAGGCVLANYRVRR